MEYFFQQNSPTLMLRQRENETAAEVGKVVGWGRSRGDATSVCPIFYHVARTAAEFRPISHAVTRPQPRPIQYSAVSQQLAPVFRLSR